MTAFLFLMSMLSSGLTRALERTGVPVLPVSFLVCFCIVCSFVVALYRQSLSLGRWANRSQPQESNLASVGHF